MSHTSFFKITWLGLRASCLLDFLIQMSLSFYGQIRPDETVPKTTRKALEDIEFPVVFKICMNPSFNDTELQSVGYDNPYFYFLGKSMLCTIWGLVWWKLLSGSLGKLAMSFTNSVLLATTAQYIFNSPRLVWETCKQNSDGIIVLVTDTPWH